MTLSEAVKCRVTELLKERNLTQYKLEQRAGLSHYTLKAIMKGRTKGVDLKTVFALSSGFEMSVAEFFSAAVFDYDARELEF